MRKIWIVVVLIALLGLVVWANSRKTASLSEEPIKIGAVLPMTGIGANYGENQANAIVLAIKEINDNGGVMGRNLELILEDDATDPKKTVSAFQKLSDIDGVPVVIGAVWDFLANAAMPIIDAKRITTISASAPPDTLEKTSEVFFTTFPPVSVIQPVIEKYLRAETGKSIAIIYLNNAWGKAHRDVYQKAAMATGKTIVKMVELPKFDNNDIQREITLLKGASPDILLTAVNIVDPKLIIEKNSELGLNARVFGHDNIVAASVNQGINPTPLKGTVVYRLALPSSKFVDKYRSTYDKDPISEADKAYDAVYVIAKAIEISREASSQGIVAGMRKIDHHEGVSGLLNYTVNNWPLTDTARLEIFDGTKFVPYLTN